MIHKITVISVALLALSGCVTAPSPTIASLGAGSDSASLNASRGRADAQISSAQAQQYSRQRNQVSEEMDLEQKKKGNTINNTQGVINAASSIMGMIPH